jgi:hypothetical protein
LGFFSSPSGQRVEGDREVDSLPEKCAGDGAGVGRRLPRVLDAAIASGT